MKKIISFALAISTMFIAGCARDVPQKTLLMKNESEALKSLCFEGRAPITYAFKGSMSTIFIYCEPAKDSSLWKSEIKMMAFARGWTLKSSMSSDVYCLNGVVLVATSLDKPHGRRGLIFQYPNSDCGT
jgi:hypothetical protein